MYSDDLEHSPDSHGSASLLRELRGQGPMIGPSVPYLSQWARRFGGRAEAAVHRPRPDMVSLRDCALEDFVGLLGSPGLSEGRTLVKSRWSAFFSRCLVLGGWTLAIFHGVSCRIRRLSKGQNFHEISVGTPVGSELSGERVLRLSVGIHLIWI